MFAFVAKSNLEGGMGPERLCSVFQCSEPEEDMFPKNTFLDEEELDLLEGSSLASPRLAVAWLQKKLKEFGTEPCPVRMLYQMAKEEEQISAGALYRASKFLKIRAEREGFGGACTWKLPAKVGPRHD